MLQSILGMEPQIFQKSSKHNKILHATVQNLDAQAIWHPHSMHSWYHFFARQFSRWYIALPLAFKQTFTASYRSAGEIKDTTSWSDMQKQQTTPT